MKKVTQCVSSQEDAAIFEQLRVVNTLIKFSLLEGAESILDQYSFEDLSVGLQIYSKLQQSRLYLASFKESGMLYDLQCADQCATDIVELAKEHHIGLKCSDYLVLRILCKMKLAEELHDPEQRAEAKSFALHLINVGFEKYPQKEALFNWMLSQVENGPC